VSMCYRSWAQLIIGLQLCMGSLSIWERKEDGGGEDGGSRRHDVPMEKLSPDLGQV
jgi:hypothetical protein